ncbi:MAG: hypothetical protein KGO50_16720, partial [Myxococcales bacterium]|nr:hypothetical protein [Myxococcales bacterium]
ASNASVVPDEAATPADGAGAAGVEQPAATDVEGSGSLEAPVVQGDSAILPAESEPASAPAVDTAVPAETAPSEGSSTP